MKAMFHLAMPVSNLEESRAFYVDMLGCQVGRQKPTWLDIYFLGHQITLHQKPDQVLPLNAQGVRHFGATLAWQDWEDLVARLVAKGVPLADGPSFKHVGRPEEQGKVFLRDPSGNVIELKTYKNPEIALELPTLF